MKIGLVVRMEQNLDEAFEKVSKMGIKTCQLVCWDSTLYNQEKANEVIAAREKHGIEITAFWCGWGGPIVWDFISGPLTLGIVPEPYRYDRIRELKLGSDFAKMIGVKDVVTHLGFIPEVACSSEYNGVVCAVRDLANYMKNNEQNFLFETGQETPVTLRRLIEDVGTGNLGINLDPANLILYGKANPVDALDVFGQYVMGVHGKDGMYPTDGRLLGKEVRIGDGKANYPAFIAKLKELGYNGAITIEREIKGEQQIIDIEYAKKYLEQLI